MPFRGTHSERLRSLSPGPAHVRVWRCFLLPLKLPLSSAEACASCEAVACSATSREDRGAGGRTERRVRARAGLARRERVRHGVGADNGDVGEGEWGGDGTRSE